MYLELDLEKEAKKLCKGKIYKAKHNVFINSKGEVVSSKRMVPMKRLSCRGCGYCGFFEEDSVERLMEGEFDVRPEFTVGSLYYLIIVDTRRDYETGIVDDYGLAFIKIEEV